MRLRTDRGALAIFVAALLWSTGGLFIKEISLDAWGVSCYRSTIAALTIGTIYLISGRRLGPSEPWFTGYHLLCAFFYALLLVLFVIATKLTTSANAIFLQYTAPVYVLFVEPMLAGHRVRRSDLLTVALSTAAMALFFIGQFEARGVWGNIAALASGVAFATYAVLLKHERATVRNRWQVVILGHGMIAMTMLILAACGVTMLTPGPGDLMRLLYLGVIQIGVAYGLFTYGITHVRAIDATLIAMIEPVLNPVWVFLGMGERPTTYAIAGGLIILLLSIIRTLRGSGDTTTNELVRAGE